MSFVTIHRQMGVCCNKLGQVLEAERHFARAESCVNALDLSDPAVILEHAHCASSSANVYARLGRPTESIARLEQALQLFESCDYVAGRIHTMALMASYKLATGQGEAALHLLASAQDMCTNSALERDDQDELMLNIGRKQGAVYMKSSRFQEALTCFNNLHTIAIRHCGEESGESASAISAIGSALLGIRGAAANSADSIEEARALTADVLDHMHRALRMYNRVGMGSALESATVLGNLGSVETLLAVTPADYATARAHLDRCCAIRRRLLPPDHPQLADALKRLSKCMTKMGNGAGAEGAAAEASRIVRRSQTACAGPGCARKLREDGAPLDQCTGCLRTFYCGTACQTADWKRKGGTRRSARSWQRRPQIGRKVQRLRSRRYDIC